MLISLNPYFDLNVFETAAAFIPRMSNEDEEYVRYHEGSPVYEMFKSIIEKHCPKYLEADDVKSIPGIDKRLEYRYRHDNGMVHTDIRFTHIAGVSFTLQCPNEVMEMKFELGDCKTGLEAVVTLVANNLYHVSVDTPPKTPKEPSSIERANLWQAVLKSSISTEQFEATLNRLTSCQIIARKNGWPTSILESVYLSLHHEYGICHQMFDATTKCDIYTPEGYRQIGINLEYVRYHQKTLIEIFTYVDNYFNCFVKSQSEG